LLNWQRDPDAERRPVELERELALFDWIESEIDLIEADLPSPGSSIDANPSAC
jgi:hypothetical protein